MTSKSYQTKRKLIEIVKQKNQCHNHRYINVVMYYLLTVTETITVNPFQSKCEKKENNNVQSACAMVDNHYIVSRFRSSIEKVNDITIIF